MVCDFKNFPTIEETLDMIDKNRSDISYLEYRLVELKTREQSLKDDYKNRKGTTYEELFGEVKSKLIKQKISDKLKGTRYGSNNPAYKHGKTPLCNRIRRMIEYKKWRTNIYQRDNWTCQTCGIRGIKLEAHHITSFAEILINNMIETLTQAKDCDALWDIDNGVTLCRKCHNLVTYHEVVL